MAPFFPDPLKSVLRRAAGRAAGTHALERRIEALERALFELAPETVTRSAVLDAAIAEFVLSNALEGLDVTVSKNDIMFQYIQQQQGNKPDAYLWYLESGLQMQRIVEAIAARKWGSLQKTGNVLDFASGYGRLTRFLSRAMPPARVRASDVKADAVRFLRHQFGVNGFVSSSLPAPFSVDERFDLIFVASLFSHLPDNIFLRWLQQLVDLLSPEGVIAFSVHDVGLTGEAAVPLSQQIPVNRFTRASEEVMFRSENEPLSVDTYGTTIVNEAYVAGVIAMLRIESKLYGRYPRAVHGIQDLYLISRDPVANFAELDFPRFPRSLDNPHPTR